MKELMKQIEWRNFKALAGQELLSPSGRSRFTVERGDSTQVVISTGMGQVRSKLYLKKESFQNVLDYLAAHGHHAGAPCPILSHNLASKASALCVAARAGNGPRKITYVLPILAQLGLVAIDSTTRPTSTWLLAPTSIV